MTAWQKVRNLDKHTILSFTGIMSLKLYPYGYAQESQGPNGSWTFRCQHGPPECEGNLLEACILVRIVLSWSVNAGWKKSAFSWNTLAFYDLKLWTFFFLESSIQKVFLQMSKKHLFSFFAHSWATYFCAKTFVILLAIFDSFSPVKTWTWQKYFG